MWREAELGLESGFLHPHPSSWQWGRTLLHPGELVGGKVEWSGERRQNSESGGGGAKHGPQGPWRDSLTVLRSRAAEERSPGETTAKENRTHVYHPEAEKAQFSMETNPLFLVGQCSLLAIFPT